MTYQVAFSTQANRFLKHLDKALAIRILDKLEEIGKDPFRYLEHYEGEGYKLRIGRYRALVDVDQKRRILLVRVFDKRGRVYK